MVTSLLAFLLATAYQKGFIIIRQVACQVGRIVRGAAEVEPVDDAEDYVAFAGTVGKGNLRKGQCRWIDQRMCLCHHDK